jgi:N-methylhydantoinase B
MASNSDPITLEIVKNALSSLADEMALVILRSAHSPIVRDSMDYSSAICDRTGQIIAQGLTNPVHLGSFPDVMSRIVADHSHDMGAGDSFLINDPYGSGGMHLPDIFLIKPIYVDGELEGYAATVVHHADVGGMAPGSMALQATEIFQEGLRIPILKLFERGALNQGVMRLLEANSRTPDALRGDLGAQIAACATCSSGFEQLVRKYTSAAFRGFLVELHDYAERLTRQALREMPAGEYEYEDFVDGLGSHPVPIRFKVRIAIADGRIVIDWDGTSRQVKGAINGPVAITRSVALAAVRCAIDMDIPNFAGYMRPIEVRAPLGSIVNPELPAACAARGVIAYRMLDTLFGALAKVPGSRIPAMGEGGPSVVSFGGWRGSNAWLITDGILGTWGGRAALDGVDGIASPGANLSNQPVELIEARFPLKITHYGFVPNSGGGGKFRGGLAIQRGYELLDDQASVSVRSDRRAHLPAGSAGGLPGSPSLTYLTRDSGSQLLPVMPMETLLVSKGDKLVHIAAGGGGYGDPLERDPTAVLDDVLDDKIDVGMAREVYGVVIASGTCEIDKQATRRLRAELRSMSQGDRLRRQFTQFARRNGLPETDVTGRS